MIDQHINQLETEVSRQREKVAKEFQHLQDEFTKNRSGHKDDIANVDDDEDMMDLILQQNQLMDDYKRK